MAGADSHTDSEIAALRTRIAQLEAEIAELRRSTAITVADAEDSLYWFERWGVDFNSLMGRPQAEYARKAFRGGRDAYRSVVKFKRHLLK